MWSEALQNFTRDALSFNSDFVPMRDELYFKNCEGGYSSMTLADYANQNPRLVDRQNAVIYQYDSIDDLIAAGWALD